MTDLLGGEECLRLARWVWHIDPTEPPTFLCHFHAEPFAPLPRPGLTPLWPEDHA